MTFQILDLFSGIGGFSLGLERTGGFKTVAFCEINPFCRRVLAQHWPEVPCYDDVCTLTADRLRADGIAPDVICGGFPCQDISVAGKGAGLAGKRSGLWREYARLIGEIRPRYVIVENVSALLGRGLGDVLGDLASLGYDAEWHCIPASSVGAPHRRDRVWIIAYANDCGRGQLLQQERELGSGATSNAGGNGTAWDVAAAPLMLRDGGEHHTGRSSQGSHSVSEFGDGSRNADVRHPNIAGLALRQGVGSDPRPKLTTTERTDWWITEPDVGRVANGVSARVDRLSALGNAVVPQIPDLIGRAILASEVA